MNDIFNISTIKLKRIVALKQQIEKLSVRLQALADISLVSAKKPGRKKWKMSMETRKKIASAARARWAKVNVTGKLPKKKRTMSAAGRAKIAAAARARWAKVKGKTDKGGTTSTGPRFR